MKHSRYTKGLQILWTGDAPGTLRLKGLVDETGAPLEFLEPQGEGTYAIPSCIVVGTPSVTAGDQTWNLAPRTLAGFWSLVPPLVAILLAILFREVMVALVAGVWIGVVAIEGGFLQGSLRFLDRHLVHSVGDEDHAKILIFTCLLGAVVAMISRMGGVVAVVNAMARRGQTRRKSQLVTWFLGLIVFFDDYANALLVGNTMRPISDRCKISREKLAFLVDCTSAPVACIAPVSTWIASEVSYIGDWLDSHGGKIGTMTGDYDIFLRSVPYNFYPLLVLFFTLSVIIWKRDYGPMARAEKRAVEEGKLLADGAMPLASEEMDGLEVADPNRLHWWNGIVPVVILVSIVLCGLYLDGIDAVENPDGLGLFARIRAAFGEASSTSVLMWASFGALCSAWVLALIQRLMTMRDAAETTLKGLKAMMPAVLVLILAWSLADVCKTLNTSGFLIEQVSFSFSLLPLVTFLLAAVIAFSTGTSWGTMAILVPLTLSFATQLGLDQPVELLESVVLASLGSVLAGAVFGDHCSPISDTTVMSSMACGSDHVDHVRTQLPYALTVGVVAALVGYLPAGFGFSPGLSLLAGGILLLLILKIVGRPTPEAPREG